MTASTEAMAVFWSPEVPSVSCSSVRIVRFTTIQIVVTFLKSGMLTVICGLVLHGSTSTAMEQ